MDSCDAGGGGSSPSKGPRIAVAPTASTAGVPLPLFNSRPSSALVPEVRPRSSSPPATDLRPLIEGTAPHMLAYREVTSGPLPSPAVATLSLQQEVVLNTGLRRAAYQAVHLVARLLPLCTLYGGTLALLVCTVWGYRWGVFISMLLYSVLMCVSSWQLVVFGAVGIVRCWICSRSDWSRLYSRGPGASAAVRWSAALEAGTSQNCSSRGPPPDLLWHDVFHVVLMPTFETPYETLAASLRSLQRYEDARTNMGVCLAFEDREEDCEEKAHMLIREYEDHFRFVTASFHPSNLARHVEGKASNQCWAFFEMVKELKLKHGFEKEDRRVVVTVVDADSQPHPHYFEALTYSFLAAREVQRYLSIWQPPVVHFMNYLSQPPLVRTASIFRSLHELACLANPLDCHVPFCGYSLSLVLASSVGGWDPEHVAEDWHMLAKCALMTEGRARTRPIFLPLLNRVPVKDTFLASVQARQAQADRHALGLREIVYVISGAFLGALEAPSLGRAVAFLWRMLPLLGKLASVHFLAATLAVWPILSHLLLHAWAGRSWCPLEDLCANFCTVLVEASTGLALGLLVAGGLGVVLFELVKDRVEHHEDAGCVTSNPLLHWVRTEVETAVLGWPTALLLASVPEWVAAARVIAPAAAPQDVSL